MRKEMRTIDAMKNINITGETEVERFAEMIERMRWARYDIDPKEWERLDYMNAHISDGRTLISYGTAVAYFDGVNIYEMGCYSRTTSKQVTRFAEYHPGADIIRLKDADRFIKENHIEGARCIYWI